VDRRRRDGARGFEKGSPEPHCSFLEPHCSFLEPPQFINLKKLGVVN
jgi:hypothetical protein